MMEIFRQVSNECIRIGLDANKTSLKSLSLACYPRIKNYPLNSAYKLCAISRAAGILTNYRKLSKKHKVRRPYCTRPSLITCYGLKLRDGKLSMPAKLSIQLNNHSLQFLSQPDLEIRSVTLGPDTVSISVLKGTEPMKWTGMLGIDRNLNNVTTADTEGNIIRYDLSRATIEKAKARQAKRRFTRNDVRIRRVVYGKYGTLQRNRVGWILHNISSSIVKQAKTSRLAIVMEDIKGIRKLYRKGNGQRTDHRARLNSWSFAELQTQIEYKAKWEGIVVYYVSPKGTSVKCSKCDDRMFVKESRTLECPSCGLTIDRDVNAARNILKAGLRFKPLGPPVEAVKGNETTTPILRVDGGKSSRGIAMSRQLNGT